MTFNELVGAHPVEKVLSALPGRENNVWVAIVDRTQHQIRDEARHTVNQSGAFSKPLFERVGVLLRDIDTIGDSYHCVVSLWSHDTRWVDGTAFVDREN